MLECPCKDCETRQIGCHSSCERYKSYRAAHDEFNELIKKKKMIETEYNKVHYHSALRERYSKQRKLHLENLPKIFKNLKNL